MLYPECRHIMTSGKKCEAPALKDSPYCYYHTRHHLAANKKFSSQDSIEIPVMEDRFSLQLVLAQVLKHLVNNNIDRHRAALLLYGLQIASQNFGKRDMPIDKHGVKSLTHTQDGEELGPEKISCELTDRCPTCAVKKTCATYAFNQSIFGGDDEKRTTKSAPLQPRSLS